MINAVPYSISLHRKLTYLRQTAKSPAYIRKVERDLEKAISFEMQIELSLIPRSLDSQDDCPF